MDAVLFDLFGTLVPNLAPEVYASATTRIAETLEVDVESFRRAWAEDFAARMDGSLPDGVASFDPALARIGAAATAERRTRANELRREFLRSALVPRRGALELLDALRERGIALALVSDCSSDAPTLLDETPLGPYFPVRACSAHLGTRKPDARMYTHALEGLGILASRALYVGDGNSHELPGARAVGLTTVWVDNGAEQHWEERFTPGGDHTVRDIAEVLDLTGALRPAGDDRPDVLG